MAKTWLPDPSHYPEQMTPLSASVWFASMGRGLHEATPELAGPFGGFETRIELGWAYEGELEPAWEHEPAVLREAALTLADRWERELRPRVERLTAEQEAMRPEEPPPTEAVALLDRLLEIVREQWTIHFLVVVPAQVAMELLHDRYVELLGDADPLGPYRLLEGLPNESTTADRELARLAERARELGLERWHELSPPREAESPQLTLESIRLLLEAPRPPTQQAEAERERFEAETLARAPELSEVLEPVKAAAPLKETHTYFVDYPALLATREVLLGFGRRLAAGGALADPG